MVGLCGCSSTEPENESVDQMHEGVRLRLSYHPKSDSIQGTLTNTTDQEINDVRVEIHLKNGEKLAPVTQERLFKGQEAGIGFNAKGKDIEGWTAHVEIGDPD